MPNKILVIGSNSFSGSHFVNYLLTKGYKVLGSSRSNQPKKVFLPYLNNKNIKNFKFIRCNLNLNQKPLVDLIKKGIISIEARNLFVSFNIDKIL